MWQKTNSYGEVIKSVGAMAPLTPLGSTPMSRDKSILLYFHLFFFLTILSLLTYFAQDSARSSLFAQS